MTYNKEDKGKGRPKVFESINHTHSENTNQLDIKNCTKCAFESREQWLENTLQKQDANEKLNYFDPILKKSVTKTLTKITVIRGKFDDCIGIQKDFE